MISKILVFIGALLAAAHLSFAVSPNYPNWASQGYIFQLPFEIKIDGENQNAFAVIWSQPSPLSDGEVEFGYVDDRGHWESFAKRGRYDAISRNIFKIYYYSEGRKRALLIDNERSVVSLEDPDEVRNRLPKNIQKIQVLDQHMTVRLQPTTAARVLAPDGAPFPFLRLEKPIRLYDGKDYDVVLLQGHVAVWGTMDQDGIWHPSKTMEFFETRHDKGIDQILLWRNDDKNSNMRVDIDGGMLIDETSDRRVRTQVMKYEVLDIRYLRRDFGAGDCSRLLLDP